MGDCGLCGGPGVPLGVLGQLSWFRCRNCGIDFNIRIRRYRPRRPATIVPPVTKSSLDK